MEKYAKILISHGFPTVMFVTGCGGASINYFTSFPGSSNYALEASNLYAKGSLELLLGKKIDKYVSPEVAE